MSLLRLDGCLESLKTGMPACLPKQPEGKLNHVNAGSEGALELSQFGRRA